MITTKDKLPAPLKTAAVTKLAPWPTQEKVKDLAADADRYYSLLEEVVKVSEKLSEANDYTRKQIIERAEMVQKRLERISHRFKDMQKEWDECHPNSWLVKPEESNRPVYSEVAKMITILMGSFPTAKIPEPEIFVRALMDDVMALDPSFVEMESTCRELRKTNKFMPSISEVIEELEKQQELWDQRSDVVWFLEEWYEDLPKQIASAKAAEEAILARKKAAEEAKLAKAKALADRMAAKSQPLAVGDRVRNCRGGAGTVVAAGQFDGDVTRYRVRFDALDQEYVLWLTQLERLIPGDEGYEHPAVPMIEHRKDVSMAPIDSPDTVKIEDDEF